MLVKLKLYLLRTGYHRPVCRSSGIQFGINGFKFVSDRIQEGGENGLLLFKTSQPQFVLKLTFKGGNINGKP
jgi:hypothetical protein